MKTHSHKTHSAVICGQRLPAQVQSCSRCRRDKRRWQSDRLCKHLHSPSTSGSEEVTLSASTWWNITQREMFSFSWSEWVYLWWWPPCWWVCGRTPWAEPAASAETCCCWWPLSAAALKTRSPPSESGPPTAREKSRSGFIPVDWDICVCSLCTPCPQVEVVI